MSQTPLCTFCYRLRKACASFSATVDTKSASPLQVRRRPTAHYDGESPATDLLDKSNNFSSF
jgi:hypothetical protein